MAIMALVAVTLSAMIMEGAGIDWAAIYMRDVFAVPPFLSGFAVALGAMPDRSLLDHFARGGEAAEAAFATLVERHGPMVLRV